MGLVFSAFSWSYAALQIPGGIFLDRFGTRLTYFIAVVCWSAFTGLMGVVRSLDALILTRIGVGVFEAPCFPANSRILATWFPQQERARANSHLFVRAVRRPRVPQRAALLDHAAVRLARPVLHRRRRSAWCSGCVWWALYRNPAESTTVNRAELEYIEAGGGGEYKGEPLRFKWRHIARAAAPPPGGRRVDRPVRRQLDAGVLRHLVSDLPGHARAA